MTAGSGWPGEPFEFPNVERADDPLTPERLLCRSAARWHLQPRPGGMGWMPPLWFPRSLHWCLAGWPAPDLRAGPVQEEASGLLEPGSTLAAAERAEPDEMLRAGFFQEAAPGLTIPGLERVTSLQLSGLEGSARMSYALPRRRPQPTLRVGRRLLRPASKLFTLILDLDEGCAIRVWGAPLPLSAPELRDLSEDDLLGLPVELEESGWTQRGRFEPPCPPLTRGHQPRTVGGHRRRTDKKTT